MNGSFDTALIAAANSTSDPRNAKLKFDLGEVVDHPAIVILKAE